MSARSINPVLRASLATIAFKFDTTKTFKSGQLGKFNVATGMVEPALTTVDGRLVVGIVADSFPPEGQPGGPNDPGPLALPVIPGKVVWPARGKDGETYTPLAALVLDDGIADGQSVRLRTGGDNTADTIGYVDPESVAAAGTTVAAATGLTIGVLPIISNGPLANI